MPALLLTMVRSRTPRRWSAAIRCSGTPHTPKPPIMIVAPSWTACDRRVGVAHDLVHAAIIAARRGRAGPRLAAAKSRADRLAIAERGRRRGEPARQFGDERRQMIALAARIGSHMLAALAASRVVSRRPPAPQARPSVPGRLVDHRHQQRRHHLRQVADGGDQRVVLVGDGRHRPAAAGDDQAHGRRRPRLAARRPGSMNHGRPSKSVGATPGPDRPPWRRPSDGRRRTGSARRLAPPHAGPASRCRRR